MLVERHYSAETKKAYQEDIDDFVNFLKANGGFKDFAHVDHLDVSTYLTELSNRKLSRASVARKMSSLRSFYRYLIRMDQAKSDPFELVETRKSHHHLPDFFSMKKKFKAYSRQLTGIRRLINATALC